MSELAYLGLVFLLSAVGSAVIWYRNRRPQSLEAGVDDFARGLRALQVDSVKIGRRRSG